VLLNVSVLLEGASKNPWFFGKPQGLDFEEKRKRRFSFFVRSKNPGRVFRDAFMVLPRTPLLEDSLEISVLAHARSVVKNSGLCQPVYQPFATRAIAFPFRHNTYTNYA
jgi:hypothetical protein